MEFNPALLLAPLLLMVTFPGNLFEAIALVKNILAADSLRFLEITVSPSFLVTCTIVDQIPSNYPFFFAWASLLK